MGRGETRGRGAKGSGKLEGSYTIGAIKKRLRNNNFQAYEILYCLKVVQIFMDSMTSQPQIKKH